MVDSETNGKISDEVEHLFVESHFLTISSEILTPEVLKREQQLQKKLEYAISSEQPSTIVSKEIIKPNKTVKLVCKPPESVPQQPLKPALKVTKVDKSQLLTLKLKSGERVLATKELLISLRTKFGSQTTSKNGKNDDEITVFKIQSEIPASRRVIHVPFSDRLSSALKRLNPVKAEIKLSPLKNGKIVKPLKLRAALDKSTIAWSSTTKTRPKATLMDQLNAVASTMTRPPPSPSREIPSDLKNHHKAQQLVPVVIKFNKFKSSASTPKLLPTMKSALNYIQEAHSNGDHNTCNGQTLNGENTAFH